MASHLYKRNNYNILNVYNYCSITPSITPAGPLFVLVLVLLGVIKKLRRVWTLNELFITGIIDHYYFRYLTDWQLLPAFIII